MIEIGYGLCRGPEWQSGKWPIVKGSISAQDCANACAAKKGCTAFDLSKKAGKKFNCHLYGNKTNRALVVAGVQDADSIVDFEPRVHAYLNFSHSHHSSALICKLFLDFFYPTFFWNPYIHLDFAVNFMCQK